MPASRRLVFRLDDTIMCMPGAAARITDATAADARGPLPLVRRTAADDGSLHLRTAWFGNPAHHVVTAGAWAARMFAAERAFFADDDATPYSVFVRVLHSHDDRANGIGQETSYMSWIGPRTTFARRLKVNIARDAAPLAWSAPAVAWPGGHGLLVH